jgi:succinate-semialdehyde dehydrogenase/glutarate-semialdehyde dehydrogenase
MLRDVIAAVITGNAAVVKPSEVTPLICVKAKEIWDACGMPEDLFGMVTGYGATGAALIDAGIDLCVFTGSVATGKRVAAACGERLIPCIMELGGKAPLIACHDCDIERTARGIVAGGFAISGQVCISVERVYAHRDVYDRVLERTVELTRALRHGDPALEFCDIGGITFDKQIEVAEKHIADAVAKGAELRCGGKRIAGAKMAFEPTVLAGCNHDCTVMTQEIFGPIVPFMQVSSDEEALALANQSHLGLNAYVFTEDAVRGRRLAERIEAGSVVVNEVLINGGIGEAPFGGIKHSGFGRVMGEEGLRAMCHVRHLCLDRFKMPAKNPLAFPYTEKGYRWALKGTRAMFTSGGLFKRLSELF